MAIVFSTLTYLTLFERKSKQVLTLNFATDTSFTPGCTRDKLQVSKLNIAPYYRCKTNELAY